MLCFNGTEGYNIYESEIFCSEAVNTQIDSKSINIHCSVCTGIYGSGLLTFLILLFLRTPPLPHRPPSTTTSSPVVSS